MKKFKANIIIFSIIFLFCFVNCIVVKFVNFESTETHLQEENLPKLSNNGINIITPENITYSRTMNGYYPGTFGFENDITGNIGTEISFVDYYGGNELAIINDEIGNHKKILKLIDQSTSEYVHVAHNITQTYGTWEFWVYSNDTSKRVDIRLHSGGSPLLFVWLFIEDNKFVFHNGGGWVDVPNVPIIQNNTWYHVRIDFRCDGETIIWQGLNQNRWQLIINGVSSGELTPRATKTSITELRLVTDVSDGDYCSYFDAFGFSCDPNYNIGDNLNEGLLLSYENSTRLDWIGYSLDGQSNKTILGSTTIPIPEDGVHTVQVFGNNTLGTGYQSNIRYFTVDFPIDIITPQEKIYYEPMSGYYPATFGFENDINGDSNPENFNNFYAAQCDGAVFSEIAGHKKVFGANDSNNSGSAIIKQHFNDAGFQNQTHGTVEYWFRVTTVDDNTEFRLNWGYGKDDAAIILRIAGATQQWQYNDGVTPWVLLPNIHDPIINTWYHMRFDFRCGSASEYLGLGENQYNITINGNNSGSLPFTTPSSEIAMFVPIYTAGGPYGGNHAYIDAIRYSWDSNYNFGDNLNEGLLLSIVNNTKLDWIGYSLDGQLNRTIWGNNTIPLPKDGSHVIRVFGNSTSGTIYESNIRCFSIHHINILTPEDKIHDKPMSGYYPATYGFEDTLNGNDPINWTDTLINWQVIEEFNGHEKVFNCYEDRTNTIQNWTAGSQDNGTVEFWVANEDSSSTSHSFQCRISGNNELCTLAVGESGNFSYQDDTGFHNLKIPVINNQWYHIRIDFETTLGEYQELGKYTYYLYINQIQYGPYRFRYNQTPYRFMCWSNIYSHNRYLDAVGYSWDQDYNIGDNTYEGLLLSFENSTALNWTGYSLDYQPMKTILGNTTFLMPENGIHTIQVFGNDSIGTKYNSELRYFTVDYQPIRIITPENKTYTEPMSGYYPATYGFENDEKGTIPDKWVDSSGSGCSVEVMKELGGHKKIVDFNDTSSGGAATLIQDFTNPQIFGTIELWIRISDVADSFILYLDNDTSVSIFPLQLFEGKWKWYNPFISDFAVIPGLPDPRDNIWHHIRLDFECSSNGYMGLSQNYFKVTIDGIESYPLNFQKYSTEVTRITLRTDGTLSNYHAYVNALGYSWDPNYNVGDNMYEGLLLSFENSPAFNWIGYSIDSEPINTIMGNISFPLPEEGVYKIQVFGNDTFGINYQSDVRYFSLDFNAPNISINSPRYNELFGSTAPNFNITIIELRLDSMWYTIDAGITNSTISEPTGMINQTEWEDRPNGTVSIRFYANDTVGYFGYEEVVIKKDVIPPQITIDSPSSNQIFRDSAPSFNISILEGNLDKIWYTLDDGLVNITCGTSGQIIQQYWSALRPGDYILKFYANDTLDNLGYSELTIKKKGRVIPVYNPIIISLLSITGIAIIIHKIKKKIKIKLV